MKEESEQKGKTMKKKKNPKNNNKKEKTVCFDLHPDSIVLSLDLDSIFYDESFGIGLDLCISEKS